MSTTREQEGHPEGVETRDLLTGWQGVAHHGDGTVTKVWAVTEAKAEAKALKRL